MQPIHHVFFSSIDFVSLVEGAGVPLPRFQCALPSQCALCFGTPWANLRQCKRFVVSNSRPILADIRITVSLTCFGLSPGGSQAANGSYIVFQATG